MIYHTFYPFGLKYQEKSYIMGLAGRWRLPFGIPKGGKSRQPKAGNGGQPPT